VIVIVRVCAAQSLVDVGLEVLMTLLATVDVHVPDVEDVVETIATEVKLLGTVALNDSIASPPQLPPVFVTNKVYVWFAPNGTGVGVVVTVMDQVPLATIAIDSIASGASAFSLVSVYCWPDENSGAAVSAAGWGEAMPKNSWTEAIKANGAALALLATMPVVASMTSTTAIRPKIPILDVRVCDCLAALVSLFRDIAFFSSNVGNSICRDCRRGFASPSGT
jgi:hypothetical protein